MAVKFGKTGFKRGELLCFNPDDLILRESGKDGRAKEVSQAKVEEQAISILKHGQIEPIRIVKDEKERPVVVVGKTRVRAIALLNSGWLPKLEGWEHVYSQDRKLPMLVACQLGKGSEETSLLVSIEENRKRNATTPMDDLHNQNRLREELGYTDEQIADVYGCTPVWIQQLRRLDQCTAEIRRAVADGEMAVAAAIELAELPKPEQKEAFKELEEEAASRVPAEETNGHATNGKHRSSKKKAAKKTSGKKRPKITAADAKKKTRAARVAAGKGGTNRSFKEMRIFWEQLTGLAEPKPLSTLAKQVVEYMKGQLDEQLFEKSLRLKLKD